MSHNINATPVTCTNCELPVRLKVYPHPLAGSWTCRRCYASGECSHPITTQETVEYITYHKGDEDSYFAKISICDLCGCEVIPGDDPTDYDSEELYKE